VNFNQLKQHFGLWLLKKFAALCAFGHKLIPPAITMSLYFVIFGNLVGSRIGEMGGFSYMQFIVPGLIMMAVITNSYANVSSSFFSAKFQKSIEELIMSPVPLHDSLGLCDWRRMSWCLGRFDCDHHEFILYSLRNL
jgi:ABC-2 type transport system permease protein